MVNHPNTNATILLPPSASAIPLSMLSGSTSSHTLAANRETQGTTGSLKFVIFSSLLFCMCFSPLVILMRSAVIGHSKISLTNTDSSPQIPKATSVVITSKLSQEFCVLPAHFLPSWLTGNAVLLPAIKG